MQPDTCGRVWILQYSSNVNVNSSKTNFTPEINRVLSIVHTLLYTRSSHYSVEHEKNGSDRKGNGKALSSAKFTPCIPLIHTNVLQTPAEFVFSFSNRASLVLPHRRRRSRKTGLPSQQTIPNRSTRGTTDDLTIRRVAAGSRPNGRWPQRPVHCCCTWGSESPTPRLRSGGRGGGVIKKVLLKVRHFFGQPNPAPI